MKTIRLLNKLNFGLAGVLLVSMIFLATGSSFAQQGVSKKITGQVTDVSDKNGIPGVSVVIKGTQTGSITDINGNYSLDALVGSTLVYSMIGYEKQEILVADQKVINIGLNIAATSLDEVVVIGYGKTTKKEVTGSISTVKEDGFNKGTFNNPIGLIQGKVAGLSIVRPNGADPQAGYNIILRGTNTLTSGQGPLIIIDGVAGADMRNISPEEVEAMDVLKDGSAAAIYGTRGSNGVIIITTKRAKSGTSKVEYTAKFSTQVNPRGVRNLTADEYKTAIETYAPEKAGTLYGADVDWMKEVTTSNPFSQQHNLAISGGSESFSHRTTIFADMANGLLKKNVSNKVIVKTNISQKVLGNLLALDYNLSYGIKKYTPADYSIFSQAFTRNPTSSVYDSASSKYGGYTFLEGVDYYNPVAMLNERIREGKTNDASGNIRATLRLAKSFNWSNFISYDLSDWEEGSYKTQYYPGLLGRGGIAEITNGKQANLQYESVLNYTRIFGKSNIQALAGYTYQEIQYNDSYIKNSGFDSDYYNWNNIGIGSGISSGIAEISSYKSQSKLISFFGRALYSFDERFLGSVSIRREGSSRFGENNKWGWFPSASMGWRINRENFMNTVTWVNDLKLRAGYGVTGNQDFSNYRSLILMGKAGKYYYDGGWYNSYQPVTNANPNLQWEKKQEWNAGVDFSVLQGRISGAIDYYYRWSTELLYTYAVSVPPFLTSSFFANVGTVSNQGLEIALNAMPVKQGRFEWNTTLTFSKNKNLLVKFSDGEITSKFIETGWLPGDFALAPERLEEGKSIGTFYGPVWHGLTANGQDSLTNVSPNDWEAIGNANPKFMLGWSNSLRYTNWDLNFALRAQIGGDVLNMYRLYYENWPKLGKNILYSQFENPDFKGSALYSSKYIENASYLKLDNISLGYNFNKISKHISNLRLYATAQNVLTITGYKGLDPEVQLSGLAPGIEPLNYYPKTTAVTFGVNVSF